MHKTPSSMQYIAEGLMHEQMWYGTKISESEIEEETQSKLKDNKYAQTKV